MLSGGGAHRSTQGGAPREHHEKPTRGMLVGLETGGDTDQVDS